MTDIGRRTAGCGVLLLLWTLSTAAQSSSSYFAFRAMSRAEMDSVRVKLTWGGTQTFAIPTACIRVRGASMPMDAFVRFRRAGFEYINDEARPIVLTASRDEMHALIERVGKCPSVVDGNARVAGYVSFSLVSTVASRVSVFEAVLDNAQARALFGAILPAFESNPDVTRELRRFGCVAGSLPTDTPENVENRVAVTFAGLQRDESTEDQWTGKVLVRNNSSRPIHAPVTLVIMRDGGNAELLTSDGRTCNVHRPGEDYINLPVGKRLAPNASVETVLRFSNPSQETFGVQFRVFAGPGTR